MPKSGERTAKSTDHVEWEAIDDNVATIKQLKSLVDKNTPHLRVDFELTHLQHIANSLNTIFDLKGDDSITGKELLFALNETFSVNQKGNIGAEKLIKYANRQASLADKDTFKENRENEIRTRYTLKNDQTILTTIQATVMLTLFTGLVLTFTPLSGIGLYFLNVAPIYTGVAGLGVGVFNKISAHKKAKRKIRDGIANLDDEFNAELIKRNKKLENRLREDLFPLRKETELLTFNRREPLDRIKFARAKTNSKTL